MSGEQWIVVPNWERFQHYRDRDPAWIKTYPTLLNDDDYLDLSLAQRGFLHGLWLLYARSRGVLSAGQARRVLGTSAGDARRAREHLEALNEAGWIEVSASRPLAMRYPRGRERGREETERDSPKSPRSGESANGAKANPRALGMNPRALGTNPRAISAAEKVGRHALLFARARDEISSWGLTQTDLIHERIDDLEREVGSVLSTQERDEIIDAHLGIGWDAE